MAEADFVANLWQPSITSTVAATPVQGPLSSSPGLGAINSIETTLKLLPTLVSLAPTTSTSELQSSLRQTPTLEGLPVESGNNLPAALQISRGEKVTLRLSMAWWVLAGILLLFA